jgi:hypothetical protein
VASGAGVSSGVSCARSDGFGASDIVASRAGSGPSPEWSFTEI